MKRSVTIAGHETSISLEPMFWAALERAASDAGKPVNALIADIDSARLEGEADSEPDLGDPAMAVRSGDEGVSAWPSSTTRSSGAAKSSVRRSS